VELYGEEGPTGPKEKNDWVGDGKASCPPPYCRLYLIGSHYSVLFYTAIE